MIHLFGVLKSVVVSPNQRLAVKTAFDLIQSRLDGFTKEILASRSQRTLQDKSFKDLNEMVTNQELRLTNLEKFGGKS